MKTQSNPSVVHEVTVSESAPTLRDENLQRYREDGVILVRGFFRPEDYAPVLRDLAARVSLQEKDHGLSPGPREDDAAGISRRIIQLEAAFPGTQSILYDAIGESPSMNRISSDDRLLALLGQLLSPDISVHERKVLLMSMPQNQWHLAVWHQDWYYNKGPKSTITLYAPLQRTTEENGSLLMALGEHTKGLYPHSGGQDHGVQTKWHSIPPEIIERFPRLASTGLEVGDILLFDSMVPHCARLNHSDAIRFVINLRYQDLNAPDFLRDGWRVDENMVAREALARKAETTS